MEYTDKDPPIDFKKLIKKEIRRGIEGNPTLANVLQENHAEGKFIKEATKHLTKMTRGVNKDTIIKDINYRLHKAAFPIDCCLCWAQTSQGRSFWNKLNQLYISKKVYK